MKKRSARMEALLGELMPLAHAVSDNLEPGPDISRLLDWLYEVLVDQDSHAFTTVFETLRAEGLRAIWEFLWDPALDMACTKNYEDDYQSLLIAVPFLAPWTGECRGADRKALTRVLREQEILPRGGKVYWVQKPQSIYVLRVASPLQLWTFNTPGAREPYTWNYGRTTTPTVYLLVGRLEFPMGHIPIWPHPDTLIRAQSEALGWPPNTMDACAPLRWFLERDIAEPDSVEGRTMEMILAAVSAAKHWVEESGVGAEGCQIQVKEGADATLHVFIQPQGRAQHLLCGLAYEAAQVPRDHLVDKLRQVLERLNFTVVIDRPANGNIITLH